MGALCSIRHLVRMEPNVVIQKKTKARNLLERFTRYRVDILRFASDFNVPVTNNNAEQAVRSMKVKQKYRDVSGASRAQPTS